MRCRGGVSPPPPPCRRWYLTSPATQSPLRMRRPRGNPVIWDSLDSVGEVRFRKGMAGQRWHRRRAEDRSNVFPDDHAVGGDLEESAVDALVDQGVAVGQAL